MIFDSLNYIKTEILSGDIKTDVKNILSLNGKYNTCVHVSNVAERNALIAETYGLDHDKCMIAGLLHDISAVIRPEDMLNYAYENRFDICEAERKLPTSLHGTEKGYRLFKKRSMRRLRCRWRRPVIDTWNIWLSMI